MADVSIDDLIQLYSHSIVMLNNRPVYVETFTHTGKVSYFDLNTQRSKLVLYREDMFKAPTRRIGFINIGGSVIYTYRTPVRKYKVGYATENLKITTLDVRYPLNRTATKERVLSLRAPEIADAFYNHYPSFSEAFTIAKDLDGACAFDKQFAVDANRRIFYRTQFVGIVDYEATKVSDIVFDAEYSHLLLLLENNYDKATPITRI